MARKYVKRPGKGQVELNLEGCTALYIRVSTDRQVEGYSLDAQRQRLTSPSPAQSTVRRAPSEHGSAFTVALWTSCAATAASRSNILCSIMLPLFLRIGADPRRPAPINELAF